MYDAPSTILSECLEISSSIDLLPYFSLIVEKIILGSPHNCDANQAKRMFGNTEIPPF